MSRWIYFILAILVGAVGGLLYGWVVSPVEFVDTTPDTLRIDYKSDYVLMTAEAFSVDKDISLAVSRLTWLESRQPLDTVREAILFAERQGYTDADVALMRSLADVLEAISPVGQGAAP